jgi:DNA-directed RNA polymerases I, II, and III subunit RPABC1
MTDAVNCFHNLDVVRYYRIYTVVHEMLYDRGFKPTEQVLDKHEWVSKYIGLLAELEENPSDEELFSVIDKLSLLFKKGNKQLLVYFYPLDSKLCQNDMNYIHNMMGEKNATHLIIVANNKATPKVEGILGILGHNAQLFNEEELVFNITKHQLVPTHSLTSSEERDKIIKAFATSSDGKVHLDILPAIFTSDPVCKYYNFKLDDIIKIERSRKDGFTDISYRVVTYPISDKDKNH